MTKSELIDVVAQEADLTKGRAELVINAIFEAMVEALQRGDGIEIRGFGSFSVKQYGAYQGRNPRTGEPQPVEPKKLPRFKVGKDLRERVNGKQASADAQVLARKRAEIRAAVPTEKMPSARVVEPEAAEDVI